MADSLLQLSLQPLFYQDKSIWSANITGKNHRAMALSGIGYLILVIIVDTLRSYPSVLAMLGFIHNVPKEAEPLDDDVDREQRRL